jgi:hypothetical protein
MNIPPNDCPDEQPEPECSVCCDIYVEDGFGDWYCPTCKGKEANE